METDQGVGHVQPADGPWRGSAASRDQAHEGPSGMIFDWDALLVLGNLLHTVSSARPSEISPQLIGYIVNQEWLDFKVLSSNNSPRLEAAEFGFSANEKDQLDRGERDQPHEGPSGMIFDGDALLVLAS